jgi:acetyl-CoA carboxylase biotin carboxyl carrier protein
MDSKIDFKQITKLIDLLEKRDLDAFELEVEGFKIKITRNEHKNIMPQVIPQAAVMENRPASSGTEAAKTDEAADGLHTIISPMVGTFYRAPDPSSPPFVKIGEQVKPNQTVCIIEAMKLMNEIESEIDGVIEEIFAQNGKPVEYGQKLFSIKPSS